jgi:predicted amidophosphoribosyltransferase
VAEERPCPFCGGPASGPACPSCGRDPTSSRRVCPRCGKTTPTAEAACCHCGEGKSSDLAWKIPVIVAMFVLAFILSVVLALVR